MSTISDVNLLSLPTSKIYSEHFEFRRNDERLVVVTLGIIRKVKPKMWLPIHQYLKLAENENEALEKHRRKFHKY